MGKLGVQLGPGPRGAPAAWVAYLGACCDQQDLRGHWPLDLLLQRGLLCGQVGPILCPLSFPWAALCLSGR